MPETQECQVCDGEGAVQVCESEGCAHLGTCLCPTVDCEDCGGYGWTVVEEFDTQDLEEP